MRSFLVSGVTVIVLLSACSPADPVASGSEADSSSATGAPSGSADSGSSEAVPSAQAAGGLCTPPDPCEPLAPGEYTALSGETELTFTVGEGWIGTRYEEFGFDLEWVDSREPQVLSAVPYAGVVYSDVCSSEETEEIGATAADFVAFISERPGLTPRGDATDVTVGGRSGMQIDVDAADPGCVSDPPERLWLWELASVTDFHLNVGEAARLIAIDGDDGVIVFVIETFDPATFDQLLDNVQPVLDSMTFG